MGVAYPFWVCTILHTYIYNVWKYWTHFMYVPYIPQIIWNTNTMFTLLGTLDHLLYVMEFPDFYITLTFKLFYFIMNLSLDDRVFIVEKFSETKSLTAVRRALRAWISNHKKLPSLSTIRKIVMKFKYHYTVRDRRTSEKQYKTVNREKIEKIR